MTSFTTHVGRIVLPFWRAWALRSCTTFPVGKHRCRATVWGRKARARLKSQSASQRIEVYPNPTTGLVHLRLRQPMSEAGAVVVQDPTGRQVLRQNIGASSNADLNLKGLVPGLYFVQLLDGTRTVSVSKITLNQ